MDRTLARLRESNARFERENKVLLHTLTTNQDRTEPASRPASRPANRAGLKESPEHREPLSRTASIPSSTRQLAPPPLPSLPSPQPPTHGRRRFSNLSNASTPEPLHGRRRSPSPHSAKGVNPITGLPLHSPSPAPSPREEFGSPLAWKHSQRIRESRSSIFGSSEEPEQAAPPPTQRELDTRDAEAKKAVQEHVDYWSAQKVRLFSPSLDLHATDDGVRRVC